MSARLAPSTYALQQQTQKQQQQQHSSVCTSAISGHGDCEDDGARLDSSPSSVRGDSGASLSIDAVQRTLFPEGAAEHAHTAGHKRKELSQLHDIDTHTVPATMSSFGSQSDASDQLAITTFTTAAAAAFHASSCHAAAAAVTAAADLMSQRQDASTFELAAQPSESMHSDADSSPTIADLFSAETQPPACTLLFSPTKPSTSTEQSATNVGAPFALPATNILSPVLPPAQGFSFRTHAAGDDDGGAESALPFQPQQPLQQQTTALAAPSNASTGAPFARSSSLGISPRTAAPPPSMPPLPSWCGLPQSITSTKRIKTTPLSSPASSRAPRLIDASAAAAASTSAAISIAAAPSVESDDARMSAFQFDSSRAASPPQPPCVTSPNCLWELQATPASLSSTRPSLAPPRVSLWSRPCWLVGRHTSCDIVLDHISISRLHARLMIHARTGRLYVQDLESTHGTFIDGIRISPGDPSGTAATAASATDSSSNLQAGARLLDPGCVLSFGASSRTYGLVLHKEPPGDPRTPLTALSIATTDLGGAGGVLSCALPPLRKAVSDGSVPPSPANTAHLGVSPDTALSASSASFGGGLGVRVGLPLQTSASVSSLADVRRRDRNFERKRKNVSFAADTKKIDGAAPNAAAAALAGASAVRRGTVRVSLNGSRTPGGTECDDDADGGGMMVDAPRCREISASFAAADSPARPKRQGMSAEEICLQRQMVAAAAAIPVPILKLPSFPFAPRAFSAPPAPPSAVSPARAAAVIINHLVATPSAPPQPTGVACFPLTSPLTAAASSASCAASSPSAPSLCSAVASSAMAGATCSNGSSSSSSINRSSIGHSNSGAHSSAAFSQMQQPQHKRAQYDVRQQRHPALGKHARDPSADGESVRLDTYCHGHDDGEERQLSSGSEGRQSSSGSEGRQSSSGSEGAPVPVPFEQMSAEQRQTAEMYEQLLPQPIHSPASPASFTSLSLMTAAATAASFARHPTVAVPVQIAPPFASHAHALDHSALMC